MSRTRLEIISNIKNDPENAADAFIKLQKEYLTMEKVIETLDDNAYDHHTPYMMCIPKDIYKKALAELNNKG